LTLSTKGIRRHYVDQIQALGVSGNGLMGAAAPGTSHEGTPSRVKMYYVKGAV